MTANDFDLDDILEPSSNRDAKQKPVEAAPDLPKAAGADIDHHALERKQNSRAWSLLGLLLGMCLCFGLGYGVSAWLDSGGEVVPDVEPVKGSYVAIFYQDSDIQTYSASQLEFLNSVNTANWLEEHKVDWQKIDEEDDVSRLPEPFRIMAEKHRSKLPWIVIASGKKFASEPIESNEQAMKLLEKWVK